MKFVLTIALGPTKYSVRLGSSFAKLVLTCLGGRPEIMLPMGESNLLSPGFGLCLIAFALVPLAAQHLTSRPCCHAQLFPVLLFDAD